MTRPASPVRSLLACLLLACLLGAMTAPAWADGPAVTAVFGIGGRYRPGGWCPVTVKVQNPGADVLDGQVQALSEADPNANRNGRSSANAAGASLFSRPVSVPGGGVVQTQLYTQGLDPGAGSVTVQMVGGHTRGDGRIMAQGSSTPNGNSRPAVTGTPVTDADLLLVGFGGDPGAFTGLNGRKLGLGHLPGVGAGKPMPAQGQSGLPTGTAQVVSVLPADLPDRAVGYSGVDAFLLRGDAPLDALSEVQADALKDWVAGGGHLVVVCPGADPGPYAAPFFQGLLPAVVQATGQGALALTAKPLPGVRLAAPALVTGPYGAGWVSVTTRDLAAAPLPPAFWAAVLTAPRTLLGAAAAHDGAVAQDGYGYGGDSSLLSSAVLRGPSLDAPGTWVIGLFLLAYLIVLVPVNYLILKRLDRRELAWATIPALVIVFAVGTFGVGYAAKGGSVFVNRAAIVETAAGQTSAGVRGALGLFSPRRTSYDLTLTGTGLSAALPPPLPSRFGGGGDAQASGQTRLVQTSGGAALLDAAVNMWAMRAFDFQSTTDLGGTIDTHVSGTTLTVTNHTPHALTACQIIRGGTSYPAGTLAPGGTAQAFLLPASPQMSNPQPLGLPWPPMSSNMSSNPDQSVTTRMQAALSDYARSLGQPDNGNGYYNNGSGMGQPHPAFAPAPNEALLVGWSDDPALAGPLPRVDGQAVTLHSTTLVVVHLPLPASPTASLPAPSAPPHVTAFHPIYFGTTSKSSALYQKAVDARTLTNINSGNQGRLVTVRGRSWGATDDVRHPGVTIALTPQTGQTPPFRGPTLRLLRASCPQLRPSLMMQGEFVVTGALTHPASGPQIVAGPPYQVVLVGDGGTSLTPTAPVTETGFASSRFQHIPVHNALCSQAWDVRDFAGMPSAGKPFSLRGFVSRSVLSQGQCEISLQAIAGSGPKVVILLPAQYQIKNSDVQSLMGREVVVSALVKTSAGTPAAPLVCQPSQVSLVDNPTNTL